MRNPSSSLRAAQVALLLIFSLIPSVGNALATSASYTLTAGAFVASGPLAEASNESGSVQLLGSFVETGVAAGQSGSSESGILLSSGWATTPVPVPEPGWAGLWLAGLIFLSVLLSIRNRRAQTPARRTAPPSAWLLVALLALLPAPVWAVPYDFSYQGKLADALGDPLPGPVDIRIGLYAQLVASPGEAALYSEDHDETTLADDGSFSVMIGSGTNAVGAFGPSLFQTHNVYLEIAVEGETLSPRQPISSVPWALVAEELADAPDLVNQVGDLESQLGSFPAEGDVGSELATLSAALTAVQTQLGTLSASSASVQDQLAATASQITSVYSQIGNPLTSAIPATGGGGSGLGMYDFSTGMKSSGHPLIVHIDQGEGGMMMADEFTLALTICNDPNCDSSTAAYDLAYGNVDSQLTCYESYWDPDSGEEICMTEWEDYTVDTLEFPRVLEGTDGFPLISYVDSAANTLKILHCNTASCIGPPGPNVQTATTTAGGSVGGYGSDLALGSDGKAIVSYYDMSTSLVLLRCQDLSCSSQITHTIDVTVGSSWWNRSSLAVGADGLPVVAYYNGANQDLGFAHCGTTSCGAGTTTEILDSSGDVGRNPVIAIGGSGFPAIAYHDTTNSAIKLVTCGDLACTTSSAHTVANSVSGHRKISLEFSDLGMPTVSWTDATADEVRVVSCPSTDCSITGPQQTWVTSAQDQNLVLNAEGDPVIVYLGTDPPGEIAVARLTDLSTQVASNESTAGTALATANSSQSAAAAAQSSASAAQSTATSALSTANTAQTAADAAQTSANASQSAADAAQTAANAAQITANSAEAEALALSSPGCKTNLALHAGNCPLEGPSASAGYNAIPNCFDAPMGSFCEGDGECGTDASLDNCGAGFDIYYKLGS